jgi:hypothetical protein
MLIVLVVYCVNNIQNILVCQNSVHSKDCLEFLVKGVCYTLIKPNRRKV